MWFLGSLWLVEFDAEFVSIFYITCDQGVTGGSLDYYDDLKIQVFLLEVHLCFIFKSLWSDD